MLSSVDDLEQHFTPKSGAEDGNQTFSREQTSGPELKGMLRTTQRALNRKILWSDLFVIVVVTKNRKC